MEALLMYLFKSVIWISGFALVFYLFLRNERFFVLKRLYLITGILVSFFFPLFSVHYYVEVPSAASVHAGDAIVDGIESAGYSGYSAIGIFLSLLWFAGAFFISLKRSLKVREVYKTIQCSDIISSDRVKLVKTDGYPSSFSFFSYVVVNPSIADIEAREIMNHELVHVRQKHWLDLVLIELLCVIQWFNPVAWIYLGFIRQNHEYLADEGALQQTSDPAVYKAALLNQIAGSPVITLTNSFSHSLNKKRFIMMKNKISSPVRKLKLFMILPVFAIVFISFAEPEYRYASDNLVSDETRLGDINLVKEVTGIVVNESGHPLQGAAVIIKGTTIGTMSDEKGHFVLKDVPENAVLVISYVGFETKVVKSDFNSEMIVKMIRKTIVTDTVMMAPPPPPPPPPTSSFDVKVKHMDGESHPLVLVDGVVYDKDINNINPEAIQSINVLKGEEALKQYGEKGKDGVISVTLKKNMAPGDINKGNEIKVVDYAKPADSGDEKLVIVEDMPRFPGGEKAMLGWLSENIKYPAEAVKENLVGVVIVRFVISGTGKVKDVEVVKSAHPVLDAEAARVVGSMPDWAPGHQAGKAVDVWYTVPVKFNLPKNMKVQLAPVK